jgi:hypothetical protein
MEPVLQVRKDEARHRLVKRQGLYLFHAVSIMISYPT